MWRQARKHAACMGSAHARTHAACTLTALQLGRTHTHARRCLLRALPSPMSRCTTKLAVPCSWIGCPSSEFTRAITCRAPAERAGVLSLEDQPPPVHAAHLPLSTYREPRVAGAVLPMPATSMTQVCARGRQAAAAPQALLPQPSRVVPQPLRAHCAGEECGAPQSLAGPLSLRMGLGPVVEQEHLAP